MVSHAAFTAIASIATGGSSGGAIWSLAATQALFATGWACYVFAATAEGRATAAARTP
jgi:hypothetical protein